MRRRRKIKILATLGPSSNTPETIDRLFQAGADMFRINMSHTSHEVLRSLVQIIRDIETKYDRPIGILADLQGPKLRIGAFEGGSAQLKEGQRFTLDSDERPGSSERVYLPHPEIFAAIEPGHAVLLNDGRVRLKVIEATADRAVTEVVGGRQLSDRKGVSLPDSVLRAGALTDKDRRDLDAALAVEADWIALSFIQRPDDIAEARKVVQGRAGIMAKIEKPQAFQRIDEILDVTDAVMIARGDLGVEMPLETVPGVQKQITRKARRAGKPVVVATQMLESMISAPVPTRAEVSDVATAVFEGDDERHRRGGGKGRAFSDHHPGAAPRPGIDRRRHDHVRCPADRRDARAGDDRLLHFVRVDGHPRIARTAGGADHRALAGQAHRPPPVADLGPALRRH
jgi:pyruvate kinase